MKISGWWFKYRFPPVNPATVVCWFNASDPEVAFTKCSASDRSSDDARTCRLDFWCIVERHYIPDNGRAAWARRKTGGIVEGNRTTYSELDRWFPRIPSASGMNDHRVRGKSTVKVWVNGDLVNMEPNARHVRGQLANSGRGFLEVELSQTPMSPRSRTLADPRSLTFLNDG